MVVAPRHHHSQRRRHGLYVLNALAERNGQTKTINFFSGLAEEGKLRIGVASNFKADEEVLAVFEKAVETIRSLGYPMSSAAHHLDIRVKAYITLKPIEKPLPGRLSKILTF